jgi:hypothetical protein
MHVHMYTCTCLYLLEDPTKAGRTDIHPKHIHTYIYACIHIYIHANSCTYMHILQRLVGQAHIQKKNIHTYVHTYIHTYKRLYLHADLTKAGGTDRHPTAHT